MRITKISALGALAVVAASVAMAPQAGAAYIAYVYQDGANVVATGTGSIDFTALSDDGSGHAGAGTQPFDGIFLLGPTHSTYDVYGAVTGPASIGPGSGAISASGGSGPAVGILAFGPYVVVPDGYSSGTALGTSTITWDGTTLADLGVTDGTYTWTWGTGADADSFTLYAGVTPAVPEPASLALLVTGLAGLGLQRRRRKAA